MGLYTKLGRAITLKDINDDGATTRDNITYSDITHDLRIEDGDLNIVTNYNSILQSINNILNTKKTEMPMACDFGTDKEAFIFEQNTQEVFEKLKDELITSIERWEPRVNVEILEVEEITGTDVLKINITFRMYKSLESINSSFLINNG